MLARVASCCAGTHPFKGWAPGMQRPFALAITSCDTPAGRSDPGIQGWIPREVPTVKRLLSSAFFALLLALAGATPAAAALFTTTLGTLQPNSSNCDDCFDGPVAFPGAGQDINFFGATYPGLFVGSNGYITFGAGATSFSSSPLNTQIVGKMIATRRRASTGIRFR